MPGSVYFDIQDLTSNYEVAFWATFPAWTICGRVLRLFVKYMVYVRSELLPSQQTTPYHELRSKAKVGR